MRTSAYLRSKSAPAAVGRPGPHTCTGKAGWTRRSRGLPCSVERATGRPRICFANPHRLQAEKLGPTHTRGQNGLNLTLPAVSRARWSGQRDIRVFASQIRTGFRRLPAPSPARYKRFALVLRSHPGGFEYRHFIVKITAPRWRRACAFYWSGQRDSNPRVSAWEADALPLGDARLCVG